MIDRVRTSFATQLSATASCLQELTHPEFHVHDPHAEREGAGPCHVVTTGIVSKADLHVRNPVRRTVHFIAIDHCL